MQQVAGFGPAGTGYSVLNSMWLWMNLLRRPCVCVLFTLPCRASFCLLSTNQAMSPAVLALSVPVGSETSVFLSPCFLNDEIIQIHSILRQHHGLRMTTLSVDANRRSLSTSTRLEEKIAERCQLIGTEREAVSSQESPIRWFLAQWSGSQVWFFFRSGCAV